MSTISAATLEDKVTSNNTSMLNAIHGSAKAWADYVQSTNVINDSYGVDSVTDNSTGYFTVTFTTPFASSNYVYSHNFDLFNRGSQASNYVSKSNSSIQLATSYEASPDSNSYGDTHNFVVFFGAQ